MKRAFAQRDGLKNEVRELKSTLGAIVEKLDALGKQTPATGAPAGQPAAGQPSAGEAQAPAPTGIEAQVKQLSDAVQGLVGEKTNEQKQQRRKAITDAVVAAANEQSRELVRHQLATLALDGAIDLHAENTTAEVEKALTRLRANAPGHFATPGNGAPAASGAHDVIPPGTQLHQLTEEQLARISDADFNKISKASRTSGLVF